MYFGSSSFRSLIYAVNGHFIHVATKLFFFLLNFTVLDLITSVLFRFIAYILEKLVVRDNENTPWNDSALTVLNYWTDHMYKGLIADKHGI